MVSAGRYKYKGTLFLVLENRILVDRRLKELKTRSRSLLRFELARIYPLGYIIY